TCWAFAGSAYAGTIQPRSRRMNEIRTKSSGASSPASPAEHKNETQSYDTFSQMLTAPQRHGPAHPEGLAPAASTPASGAAVTMRGAEARVGGRVVWSGVDLDVAAGEFMALLGANGAGKSTLLKALLGLQPLVAGSLSVLGSAPGRANSQIGYLPQRRAFDAGTRLRGCDIVGLGLDGDRWGIPLAWPWGPPARRRRERRRRIFAAIELVGAGAYARRPIGELSGGEQQRLLIAQALVRRPRLLLLDEPLDSLDLPNQASVSALVAQICRREGVAVLLVAHDVNPLLPYLDRVAYLAAGHAVSGAVDEVINGRALSALYGVPIEVLRTSDGRLVVVGQPEAPAHHHDRHALDASAV
ncbi:MAG TPA: ATP-binding cassette domain-containing protein, partial [Solirubrobacteraceae bacterium]|nr:ATP-binding cassette domain-containing protein [Solirubrobacteraceae bacterium]